jgi:hypothetical protein
MKKIGFGSSYLFPGSQIPKKNLGLSVERLSYRSSLSTKKNGCCSNRVVIARVDDKIIEKEIVRLDISLN